MTASRASKTWLITGCSSGLGKALAQHALQRGDRVAATTRKTADLVELLKSFPESCHAFSLDVTDSGQVARTVDQIASTLGRLDIVVNNAGTGLVGALEEMSDEEVAQCFDVNFIGTMRVIRATLPILRAQRSGHIVNVSAAAAISNYAGFSIYGAAKCAMEGLSEALSLELRPVGIRVTIVQPGPLRTDFVGRSLARARHRIPDYDATSGKFAALLKAMNGRQTGDPAKAAAAIGAAIDSDAPPLRLVLGRYAHEKVRKHLESTARELAAWEAVGLPIEFAAASRTENAPQNRHDSNQ